MKKTITLVAALAGFSLAILIPVMAGADTVTVCAPGAALQYCSVSNFSRWTVSQKKQTVTVKVRFNTGGFKLVGLGVPRGVKFSTGSDKGIEKRLSFTPLASGGKPGTTKVAYKVSSLSRSQLAVTLNSTLRSAEVVFPESLFTSNDKSFKLTLVIKTTAGDTYLEKVPVTL